MPVAEAYLLKNTLADAALLLLAARWRGMRAHPLRIALASFFGALCALVSAAAGGFFLSLPAKVAVLTMMGCIGVGPSLEAMAALVTGAALTGGAGRMGVPAAAALGASGAALCALIVRKNAPPPPCACITVRAAGREIRLAAIVDSGCRAVDPGTLSPVILLPSGLLPAPQNARALHIRTAAGTARLACFTPDAVMIDGNPVNASVAAAPALRCALVPWALCAGRRSG